MSSVEFSNAESRDALVETQKSISTTDLERSRELASVRSEIEADARAHDPDEVPDLRDTFEAEFRGHAFEFYELGDSLERIQQYADDDDHTQATRALRETFSEKCVADWADLEFWSDYDIFTGEESDREGLMDLYNTLIEASADISESEREQIDEFRGER